MDSLERLSHSLEQAVALIQSLRRENRDLAKQASSAIASAKSDATSEVDQLASELARARAEIAHLSQLPSEDLVSAERARQAELEAARLAQDLEAANQVHVAQRRLLEERLGSLELKLLAVEREETMPVAVDQGPELEKLRAELEKARGAITSLQVKIAESAAPEEVGHWQEQIQALEGELSDLRALRDLKASLDEERLELRRQRKALGHIEKERAQVKAKLDEIYSTLENVRLSS